MSKWGSSSNWGFKTRWGASDYSWESWEQGFRPKCKPDTRFFSFANMADYGDISNSAARTSYREALSTDLSQEGTSWNTGNGNDFVRTHNASSSVSPTASTPLPVGNWGKFSNMQGYMEDGMCFEVMGLFDLISIRDNSTTGGNQSFMHIRFGNSVGGGVPGTRNSELHLGFHRYTAPNEIFIQLDYSGPAVSITQVLLPDSIIGSGGKSAYVAFVSLKRDPTKPTVKISSTDKHALFIEFGILNLSNGEMLKSEMRKVPCCAYEEPYEPGTFIDCFVRVDTPNASSTANLRSYTQYDVRAIRVGTRLHSTEEIYADWYDKSQSSVGQSIRALERYVPSRGTVDFSAPGWPTGPAMLAARADAASMALGENLSPLVNVACRIADVGGLKTEEGRHWFQPVRGVRRRSLLRTLCKRTLPGKAGLKAHCRVFMAVTYDVSEGGEAGNTTVYMNSQASFANDGLGSGGNNQANSVSVTVTRTEDTPSPQWYTFPLLRLDYDENRGIHFHLGTDESGFADGYRFYIYAIIIEPVVDRDEYWWASLESEE